MKKNIILLGLAIVTLTLLTGCGIKNSEADYGMVDQLYEVSGNDVTLYAFRYGDKCIETENFYEIEIDESNMPKDGAFYKIEADVTFLDGGVAGFTHFPQIDKVISCSEISVEELSFPSIMDEKYGLLDIRDYADADYIFVAGGMRAVYKDGKWIYSYEKTIPGKNYENIFYNGDIILDQVNEGVANGIVCCEDYFVMPIQ